MLLSLTQGVSVNTKTLFDVASPDVINSIAYNEDHPTVLMNQIRQNWDATFFELLHFVNQENVRFII